MQARVVVGLLGCLLVGAGSSAVADEKDGPKQRAERVQKYWEDRDGRRFLDPREGLEAGEQLERERRRGDRHRFDHRHSDDRNHGHRHPDDHGNRHARAGIPPGTFLRPGSVASGTRTGPPATSLHPAVAAR